MEAAVAGACIQLLACVPQLCSCLCQQYDYVKNIEEKFSDLNVELQTLHGVRDDIEGEIQRRETMTPTCQTKDWIARVQSIDSEFQKLESRYKKRSCGGKCPRCCCCRLDLSKKIEKLTIDITSLTEKGNEIKKQIFVEVEPPPSRVETIYRSNIRKIFNKRVVEKVMDLLKDDSIKRIGIFGSPGVGKTAVMEKVNNAQVENNMFDIVIWVNVKKDGTVQEVQQQILERLKLNVQGIVSSDVIARKINAELRHKKYLLLLDDVLEKLNLNDVGIYDNDNGSKVVLTTLYRDTCQKMDTCEEIKVDRLSKGEALELFMEKAGAMANYPRFKTLAQRISKECGYYMGVIVVVASSLKNVDDEDLWTYVLNTLEEPNTHERSYMDEISRALRLGYQQLQDDNTKNCFLYEALYPEETEMDANYLIECWRAQGFIRAHSLGQARVNGKNTLRILMDKGLLESTFHKSYRAKCVKMPRLLRSLALSIKSANDKNCKLLVRSGEDLQETPDETKWKNITRISLMHNQLTSLPTNPDCGNLSTLLLQRNATLKEIPGSFFGNMGSLLLLDLHGTGIRSLPQSVSFLTSLKGFYLNACSHLEKLPVEISKLVNLEVLDIRGTMIRHLPIELRQLARHLRCLRVSFSNMNNCANSTPNNIIHQQVDMIPSTPNNIIHQQVDMIPSTPNNIIHQQLDMIPPGLLSDLNLLEELRIDVDLHDERWKQIVGFVLEDVSVLNELKNLQFYFPTIKSLEEFVTNSRSWNTNGVFRFFRFVVGSHDTSPYHSHILESSQYLIERYLRFSAGNGIPDPHAGNGIPDPVLQVLHHTDALELIDLQNVAELSEIHTVAMGVLRVCVVTGCKNMVCFINYAGADADDVLRFLETLELIHLPELKSIWEGIVPSKTFGRLKTLTLKGCSKLEKIFSEGLISQLLKLEELTVDDCSGITEIINETDNPTLVHDTLPALHSLVLVNLPELVSICQDISLSWSSLERIKIFNCDNLKKLPFKSDSSSKLSRIECDRTWWNALDWTDVNNEAKDRLEHFI